MLNKKRITILGSLAIVIFSIIVLVRVAATPATAPLPWPVLNNTAPPDKTTVDQLRTLVENYYDFTAHAARDFDVSKFPSILVDDPRISLETWQVEEMRNLQAEGNGILSYETAYFGGWKLGAEKLEQLFAKAKAEGRQVTKEELLSVQSNGIIPAPRRTDPLPTVKLQIEFSYVLLEGDQAIVYYDAYEQSFSLFCIKIGDSWKIAGMHVLTGIVKQP